MTEPNYTPTPEYIKLRCALIQAGWTDSDERNRRTGTARQRPYTIASTSTEALPGRWQEPGEPLEVLDDDD